MNSIKIARKEKGILQKELADQVGVEVVTLQKYESAERFPKPQHLKKIVQILAIPLEAVLDDYLNKNSGRI